MTAGTQARRQRWISALIAAAALGLPALSSAQGILPPSNPPANVAPTPNYDHCTEGGVCSLEPPCYSTTFAPAFSSASCEQQEIQAIDGARAKEGVGPIYLPGNFNSLTADEQLLVIIDIERVGRGLPPFAGIVASLDNVAQAGADVSGAKPGSFEDPQLPAGFSLAPGTEFAYRCKATGGGGYSCDGPGQPGDSIAAGGQISALDADYGWMYDDGYGGANGDCAAPGAVGCWGHRDNILGRYPTRTRFAAASADSSPTYGRRRHAVLVMGAGSQQPNGAGGPQGNFTAIFASTVGRRPIFVYSWKEALAAGANRPPA